MTRAYKWMTKSRKAFFDGYQFEWGWNEQDGLKDGQVCCAGGFHLIGKSDGLVYHAEGSAYDPRRHEVAQYEVYYRKADLLGEGGGKLRVSRFKLLKKKPIFEGMLPAQPQTYSSGNMHVYSSNDTSATGYSNWMFQYSGTA